MDSLPAFNGGHATAKQEQWPLSSAASHYFAIHDGYVISGAPTEPKVVRGAQLRLCRAVSPEFHFHTVFMCIFQTDVHDCLYDVQAICESVELRSPEIIPDEGVWF